MFEFFQIPATALFLPLLLYKSSNYVTATIFSGRAAFMNNYQRDESLQQTLFSTLAVLVVGWQTTDDVVAQVTGLKGDNYPPRNVLGIRGLISKAVRVGMGDDKFWVVDLPRTSSVKCLSLRPPPF